MSQVIFDIDFDAAEAFLDALAPSGSFTFQTFHDKKVDKKRTALIRQLHGTFSDHRETLAKLNRDGAGIFVTVNETDCKGRASKNITSVRAVFVDLDGAPLKPVQEFYLQPSIIVETSHKKWHAYWLVDDLKKPDFKKMQQTIAQTFEGDPAVNDLPRVMRLPGFYHQKGEPQRSELLSADRERRYTANQFVNALGTPSSPVEREIVPGGASGGQAVEAHILGLRAADASHKKKNKSRHSLLLELGYDCRRADLSETDAVVAAEEFVKNARSTTPSGDPDPIEVPEAVDAVLNAYKEGKDLPASNALFPDVKTIQELIDLSIPPRETIVEPFILERSLNMIVAKRGLGKTWFALQLACDIARGRKFFSWEVPSPRRVLYVDGEMPIADLQNRLSLILGGEAPKNLEILPSETLYLEGEPLIINKQIHQKRFEVLLDKLDDVGRAPELLVFDNLSSLTSGMDENSNSDLDEFLQWLLKLRHRGLAVILVHHAGKNGDQRGASRREDLLDTSIKLEEPSGDNGPHRGARFVVSFSKTRGKPPQPDFIEAELATDGRGDLTWLLSDARSIPAYARTLKIILEEKPVTQKALAARLAISPTAVSKQLKIARSKGWLEHDELRLTENGKSKIDAMFDVAF